MTGRPLTEALARTDARLSGEAREPQEERVLGEAAGGGYRAIARTTSVFGHRYLDMATAERR